MLGIGVDPKRREGGGDLFPEMEIEIELARLTEDAPRLEAT